MGSWEIVPFSNINLSQNCSEHWVGWHIYVFKPNIVNFSNCTGVDDQPTGGVHEAIARLYLGEDRYSGNYSVMYPGLMDIFSVFFLKAGAYDTALLHSIRGPTYWSSFEFQGSVSFWGQLFPGGEVPPFPGGVTNTDDLIYLFGLTFLPFTPDEARVSSRMLSYWEKFATSGYPSEDWIPLHPRAENYMRIGLDSVSDINFKESWVGPGYEADRPNIVTS